MLFTRFSFWGGQQSTLTDSAKLVAVGFIGGDADVGEAH